VIIQKVILLGIVLIAFESAAPLPQAAAACTIQQRVDLAKSGYFKDEIDRLCAESSEASGGFPGASVPPRAGSSRPGNIGTTESSSNTQFATTCLSQGGSCPVASRTVPIGAPCFCYLPTGSFEGQAR
jgi:hypothetical protein